MNEAQGASASAIARAPPSSPPSADGAVPYNNVDTGFVKATDRTHPARPKRTTVPSASSRRRRKAKDTSASLPAAGPAVAGGKLTHLVIDSGAIIKGAGMTLASAAESFWTVPEVVSEIRDKKARQHLEALPFELKLREPSDEAMKFATAFARQTGDLRALSRVDLRVIALTYMLERQETGASHLRDAPVRPRAPQAKRVGIKKSHVTNGEKSQEAKQAGSSTAHRGRGGSTRGGVTTPMSGHLEGADALSSEAPARQETRKAREEDKGMDAICEAVRTAWQEDVAEKNGRHADSNRTASTGGARDTSNPQMSAADEATASGTVVASDASGTDRDDNIIVQESGDMSDGASDDASERAEGGTLAEEGDKDDNDDADDDWEPEQERVSEDATTASQVEFKADDFPSLCGDGAIADPVGPSLPPTAPSESSTWSQMARSNPAPFKIPAKSDPPPLPAARPAVPEAAGQSSNGFAKTSRSEVAKPGTSRILSTSASFGVSGGGADDDDGEGWVNISNIKSHKVAGMGLNGPAQQQLKGGLGTPRGGTAATLASKCRAGCVTTDFAMQNVILQVGLPLLSLDGMVVRKVKQWILRCAACFKTCTEMGRLFCPVCGNASLDRVSCSVNAKSGATYVHLKKNFKANLRGSKFSIPAPNPAKGRFEGDLLLREDQLLTGIWAQKAKRKEKDVSSMFGEDITGNVGLTVSRSADVIVGYGRKNPNAARGRERRGKKSVKKRV